MPTLPLHSGTFFTSQSIVSYVSVEWPTGVGFSHFYGFMGGDADQWAPGNLFRGTEHVDPPIVNPQWNLTTAMADDAIQWLNELNDINPDLPFLLYYAPGGTHAPHHPTQQWIDKISAMHLRPLHLRLHRRQREPRRGRRVRT